jgi:signal transduction histidine kinase
LQIWQKISLRTQIFIILIALVLITMAGGIVSVWYTYRMEHLLTSITEKDITAFQAAEALETALVNQKGFVSYYFIEGDPEWLRQLGEFRQIFKERLNDALRMAESEREMEALLRIKSEYTRYITLKDRVIAYYQEGNRETGTVLHRQVRELFFKVMEFCEIYKDLHKERIIQINSDSKTQAANFRIIAAAAISTSFLLAVLLAFVMGSQILGPVRRLTAEVGRKDGTSATVDEVKALSHGVRGLIQDVDQTQTELQRSRESLLQAERMALVGKLAAGMAHSVRNPFTSVKMRLFSLSRSLKLSESQKEDFDVISEEIRHIDTIVQNFLEFSRPPKLKVQPISPSVVVDQAVQLLQHRLKSYDVEVTVARERNLAEIDADPEQLKEVLVNLIVNACEAMEEGGSIVIREQEMMDASKQKMAVIRVSDDGPGIPESDRDKVFQPFFTTKEEGTGLGLSIAARIIEEHHGRMTIESDSGGTTFIISLPFKESNDEHDSNYRR